MIIGRDATVDRAAPTSTSSSRFRHADRARRSRSVDETEPQIGMLPGRPTSSAPSSSCAATTTPISTSSRLLDPRVVAQLRADAGERQRISPTCEARRLGVQVAFALMYTVIALIVLLSAIWIGLEFRQPPGRADPPADRRRRRGLDRQSRRPGAGAALRRRPRLARRDLQQDDAGAAHAARRHRARRAT